MASCPAWFYSEGFVRELFFTLAVSCASRALMLRDKLLDRPQRVFARAEAGVSRHQIVSGSNRLDVVLVEPVDTPARAALLICHGIGETVEHWQGAQRLLAQSGITSLVFDYSGYGRSTGLIAAAQCERDAVAAFSFLRTLAPSLPASLLGYSLGSGIAAAVAREVEPHRLVLCATYLSLRKAAARAGLPGVLARLVPAIWDMEGVHPNACPVLIIQGEQDRLFPPRTAQELATAWGTGCELVLVPRLTHNGPIYQPQPAYWGRVAEWIDRPWPAAAAASPLRTNARATQ